LDETTKLEDRIVGVRGQLQNSAWPDLDIL